ncbi:hypothetical protein D3C87_1660480 [compost metagenome]
MILTPEFRNDSSRSLRLTISALNSMKSKVLSDGRKVTSVPLRSRLESPTTRNGSTTSPWAKPM